MLNLYKCLGLLVHKNEAYSWCKRPVVFILIYYIDVFRGGCSFNTVYLKVPIFPDSVDNFPDFPPISFTIFYQILCKLDNTLWNHNFHMVCIRPCIQFLAILSTYYPVGKNHTSDVLFYVPSHDLALIWSTKLERSLNPLILK